MSVSHFDLEKYHQKVGAVVFFRDFSGETQCRIERSFTRNPAHPLTRSRAHSHSPTHMHFQSSTQTFLRVQSYALRHTQPDTPFHHSVDHSHTLPHKQHSRTHTHPLHVSTQTHSHTPNHINTHASVHSNALLLTHSHELPLDQSYAFPLPLGHTLVPT